MEMTQEHFGGWDMRGPDFCASPQPIFGLGVKHGAITLHVPRCLVWMNRWALPVLSDFTSLESR